VPPCHGSEHLFETRELHRLAIGSGTGEPPHDHPIDRALASSLVRAWQVHDLGPPRDALRSVDLDEPTPGPGELRIRVRAAAIGLPDAFMCRGTYAFRPQLPFVPGQEVCGVVDAVGDDVDVAIGTRVMAVTNFYDGRGGFAEETIARADTAYRVPDAMSDVDAASFRIGFSTAWIGLVRRGGLQRGDTLLVLGAAGGSGAAAVQLGRALGARVIAVAAGEERLAFCERIGADVLVDRSTQEVPDAVLEATDGNGADLVYDPVGGAPARAVVPALARGGRLLAVGFASGSWPEIDPHQLVLANASLVGVYAGGYTREENEADHEALLALALDGHLPGLATEVPFDGLPEGVAAVEASSITGKLVLRMAAAG
jgi:NADPH2:quinone reductase